MVRVLELSSIIEKEKSSSENYCNSKKYLSTYRFSLIIIGNWKSKITLEQLCVFTGNVTFKSPISFIMLIKLCEVAFYFKRDHHYSICFNWMQLVSFQMGRVKIFMSRFL